MKILSLNWPIIIFFTIILYILTIVALPFSTVYATIFLFALIAYWSRLPGVGTYHPFFILYQADLVDIFTLFVAIHVGVFEAIIFTVFCNLSSRAAGIYPPWQGVIKDAIIQSVIAMMVPLLYVIVDGNIFALVAIYTILRSLGFFIFGFIWPMFSIPQLLFIESGAAIAVFVVNMFYAKLFGTFFENLLQKGVAFSWTLFLFATIVILIVSVIFFGLSPRKLSRKAKKVAKHIAKKAIQQKSVQPNRDFQEMQLIKEQLYEK